MPLALKPIGNILEQVYAMRYLDCWINKKFKPDQEVKCWIEKG